MARFARRQNRFSHANFSRRREPSPSKQTRFTGRSRAVLPPTGLIVFRRSNTRCAAVNQLDRIDRTCAQQLIH